MNDEWKFVVGCLLLFSVGVMAGISTEREKQESIVTYATVELTNMLNESSRVTNYTMGRGWSVNLVNFCGGYNYTHIEIKVIGFTREVRK